MSDRDNSSSKSDSSRETWFEKESALIYIRRHFQAGEREIRIASGFFTIKGWGLIRTYTTGKNIYLLVGLDDPGKDNARKALIQEIMRDLRTGLDRDRRKAVFDLVEKMASGQFHIVDARAMSHHAKLYLVDSKIAIMASSNLTGRGLREQIESGNIVTKTSEVIALVNEFDDYFAQAIDMTEELLEILRRWLDFVRPWDIYLKTMLALEDIQPIKAKYKKCPVSYQKDMIAQTLRQIREFGGSMLVASTGLGKTVVAVHVALHLHEEDEIDNVIVIGPKPVKKTWESELRQASLHCDYFIRQALDKKTTKQDRSLEDLEDIIKNNQEQRWLIIIDESHEFRNRYIDKLSNRRYRKEQKVERQAFIWLKQLCHRDNSKVLLLTGSPYAKDIDNIKNQLFLLPHKGENQVLFSEYFDDARAWYIEQPEDFIHLPVASQLTTPHVASYYGQLEGQEIYINFGEERRYIPKVILHSIDFPLALESDLTPAIVGGCFDLNSRNPMFRKTIERLVRVAWASSPLALRGVLERIIDTPGGINEYEFEKLEFAFTHEDRNEILIPIREKVTGKNFSIDIKLKALVVILQEIELRKEKAIVFCERRATAVYLKKGLTELIPSLRVVATIDEVTASNYRMKETKEIEEIIKKFAPVANDAIGKYEQDYDVFISTDAHGVGVNMQDASVVINYDIDWTPIGPVQRAGRVLRFWHSPRTVQVYTFVPKLTIETNLKYDLVSIMRRWENLMKRHGESRKLIDLPVLTQVKTQEINMLDVASQVTIRSGELDIQDIANLDISPYFQHTAKLQDNRDYAQSIPSDILSAKTYKDPHPSIYVLLNYKGKYHGLVYDSITKQLREPTAVKLLDLIACEENTETALVEYDLVEELSDACISTWCNKEGVNPEEVIRECALYLKPEDKSDTLNDLLNPQ
ncbi:helicase-related protein [Limnofasciculus baicalensis]|uniref:Phospholipase D-like domain-containing protein n=1 Tax=Limnofasciculus baicalensis BBK-W-15 TaxID=2699891 RepID=A0AAE3KPG3_9CYAN|nr:helicase-related protein [Limnofasciculus baicalensis]MCP2729613.1 phospholipase D-like domain-containing protein [Limnofasciculus baicalensis BBK-W-15]